MLTGDNEKVAIHVAETLKIQEVHANLLPQNKVALVEQILASKDKKMSLRLWATESTTHRF